MVIKKKTISNAMICALTIGWVLACPILFAGMWPVNAPRLPGAPEETALECQILVSNKAVMAGMPLDCTLILHNTSTNSEIQLPIVTPNGPDVKLSAYLISQDQMQTTQPVRVDHAFIQAGTTNSYIPDRATWETIGVGKSVPVHLLIHTSRADGKGHITPFPSGQYQLRIEYEYQLRPGGSTQSVFAYHSDHINAKTREYIQQAKTAGKFILDVKKLWTGKRESNLAPITLTPLQK
jgi:hypothetical protein